MKTAAIIQARMGSTRLPGKVMKLLCGRSVLSHVIRRTAACPEVDEVVVATTSLSQDDAIEKESRQWGAMVFRGSEVDVLSRYYGAARQAAANTLVRITSDCPLFDPQVLTEMLWFWKENRGALALDYLSNTLERTFPRGLDAEVFTFVALEKSYREADKEYEREHVTPYICLHPERFTIRNFANDQDLSGHRWTLDTEEDWQLISEIFKRLGDGEKIFSTKAVLGLFAKTPKLKKINKHVQQKRLGEDRGERPNA
jgi:spore coat polysaccharide biosynthesis protein SpsF